MIIKKQTIVFEPGATAVRKMRIEVDCYLPKEVVEEIKVKYCHVLSEAEDYRLLLLDAMKLSHATTVHNLKDSSWEICYHLSKYLEAYEFTSIQVAIDGYNPATINKEGN